MSVRLKRRNWGIALLGILTAGPTLAETPEILTPAHLHGDKRATCVQILEAIATTFAPEAGKHFLAGHWNQLDELLKHRGTAARVAQQIQTDIKTLTIQSPPHPILQKTLNILDQRKFSDRLFLCVSATTCVTEDLSRGMFTAVHVNFNFSDFNGPLSPLHNSLRTVPQDADNQHALFSKLNAIVVDAPNEPSPVIASPVFLRTLLHEGTHYADLSLLSMWIRANQKLMVRGHSPDFLYRRYVRDRNGIIEIDQGFHVAFSESRGYAVTDHITQTLGGSELKRAPLDLRKYALAKIENGGGGPFLKEMGTTESNVFKMGIALGDLMQQTIDATTGF